LDSREYNLSNLEISPLRLEESNEFYSLLASLEKSIKDPRFLGLYLLNTFTSFFSKKLEQFKSMPSSARPKNVVVYGLLLFNYF
jgi:hypothetical protein